MKIILYGNDCPRCKVLKAKLNQKYLPYTECNDVDEILKLGIIYVPALKVDQKLLNFSESIKWINGLEETQ